MDLQLLEYLLKDGVHYLEDSVKITKYDPAAAIGVGNFLLGNAGDIEKLSSKQKFYYEKFIKPLLENVPCEGIYGPGTCTGNDVVDDESLLISYQEENFLCQHCRYDQEKHEAE